ncbi:MAG: glycosyltransferase family 2 protein [Bacteroidota bacterium]
MKLLIAIPALNEEESIESIILRTLEAREAIIRESPVTEVAVTVVSDGSTDRTAEIARRYRDRIRLIEFEKNRGYGAAIKAAWEDSDADLLGFLDADGTCDPHFFADLCRELEAHHADISLGSRLHAGSRIPPVRRLGNLLFAFILSIFSSKRVRDTASGMRVVRRSSLGKIYPLPDGLHFTPAMSARAMLSEDLSIVETDMPYREREGESKLRIGRDGVRFLKVILDAAFLYRPSRPLGLLGAGFLAAAALLMAGPALHYLRHRSVLEWMIYRFTVADLLGSIGVLLLCAAHLTRRIVSLTVAEQGSGRGPSAGERLFASRLFWALPAALILGGAVPVMPSFFELVRTGATYEHWSRFLVSSFLISSALILATTRIVDYSLGLIAGHLRRPGRGGRDAHPPRMKETP